MGKPKILVTNDDSIHAGGIKALVKSLMPLGKILLHLNYLNLVWVMQL